MQRKTAWSNKSLVGCRVSVLLDNRDWQDGFVTQYHKSGKHCVEFKPTQQKRWLNMLKTAFYIVERPTSQQGESKDAGDGGGGLDSMLAPLDDKPWVFSEEMTTDYVRAQSIVHRVYGNKIQETGHRTAGHLCLTEDDRDLARSMRVGAVPAAAAATATATAAAAAVATATAAATTNTNTAAAASVFAHRIVVHRAAGFAVVRRASPPRGEPCP